MSDFHLTLYPAAEGDAIVLSWGPEGRAGRILVDLGRTRTYRALAPTLARIGYFDLFVVTHVDADHIEGAMPMVRSPEPPFEIGEVWHNGYHHLVAARDRQRPDYEAFGARQGEKLSDGIIRFGWRERWNRSFGGGPVSVGGDSETRTIALPGGLSLRLLSPADRDLVALEKAWHREITRLGLVPGTPDPVVPDGRQHEIFGRPDVARLAGEPYTEDRAVPNGSSIAFLAEYGKKRVLLTGDAHPSRLEAALRAMGVSEGNRLRLDCLKVSHHGSRFNTSPTLLGILDCTCFAFSTDGTRHDHPDPQTVARILVADPARPKTLVFNVRHPRALLWNDPGLEADWNYRCLLPAEGTSGIDVPL